ncbi:General transcription and DNA repair factor IIH helicase subunit XPB [Aduncisulcus paluster]|uniref:DNA 3'-5' helicase n=1 Tax=Aduncisulcus paluster TaxID=2918883 RepID=A0ABQ5JWA7_9EUKA|nr:General transcription and DNA repair factor IIH helicase subunit XPB [Aduncisulcus paluster]
MSGRPSRSGFRTKRVLSAEIEREDYTYMKLKDNPDEKPLYVLPNGKILLEVFNKHYEEARDFLISISEPVTRPELVHEYILTSQSLFSAASNHIAATTVLEKLERLSKTVLFDDLKDFVLSTMQSFGKVSLVLRQGRLFIESPDKSILKRFKNEEIVEEAMRGTILPPKIHSREITDLDDTDIDLQGVGISKKLQKKRERDLGGVEDHGDEELVDDLKLDEDDVIDSIHRSSFFPSGGASMQLLGEDNPLASIRSSTLSSTSNAPKKIYLIEIDKKKRNSVKRCASELELPLVEEYDFKKDFHQTTVLRDLKLRPTVHIRPYQEKSLSKMFRGGKARSGIIVLPCGAGKTLIGVTAACMLQRPTIVLCTTSMAIEQWKNQFLMWTGISEDVITMFTAAKDSRSSTEEFTLGEIVIATYHLTSRAAGQQSAHTKHIMDLLSKKTFGLMIFDEVHHLAATNYRKITQRINAQCRLGLTATLVREDGRERDLGVIVGPKLYEANWIDLTRQGFIAPVNCAEVVVPMTAKFYKKYLSTVSSRHHYDSFKGTQKSQLVKTMNPNKFLVLQYLINYHEKRGDKILVFFENIFPLTVFAKGLAQNGFKKPLIFGDTDIKERLFILRKFLTDPKFSCVFLSSVGSDSIDLPAANVIIEMDVKSCSRKDETQRLGRILRPKRDHGENKEAYFYVMVSQDTSDQRFAAGRRRYLMDQGYSFTPATHLFDAARQEPGLISLDEDDLLAKIDEDCAKNETTRFGVEQEEDERSEQERREELEEEKFILHGDVDLSDDMLYVEKK